MQFKKQLCARILSEANDLKRTTNALAKDINMPLERLNTILSGEAPLEDIYEVIDKMGQCYPIDKADLLLLQDDCTNGVKIVRAIESKSSARITERANRFGERTPYYEYRDTAMSRLAPFKPEWIQELRQVQDADPFNPDVIYNNGHFMHQTTFFVGPVNFYWEVDGKRFCEQMTTGDSNYITPFWKHSFTCRDPEQTALILAITFGGSVRAAQKEFYALGEKAKHYRLDFRHTERALTQMMWQHIQDENLSLDNLDERLAEYSSHLKAQDLLDESKQKNLEDLQILAEILNIDVNCLMMPSYHAKEEVVVTQRKTTASYYYPNDKQPLYRIYPLARTAKMPQMKSFDIEVLRQATLNQAFKASTHTYAYNYGLYTCKLMWQDGTKQYEEIIHPGDSFYMQPFIPHAFSLIEKPAQLYMVRVPGNIHLATQKELSYFSDIERVMNETTCWFN